MLNSAHIQGRFTKEPEMRSTANGTLCCSFTLANERVKDEVNYIKCFAWGKLAETIRQYCHQGTMIIADGYFKYRTWEGTRGKQEGVELNVERIHFCGGSRDNNTPARTSAAPPKQTDEFEEIPAGDDDLPF